MRMRDVNETEIVAIAAGLWKFREDRADRDCAGDRVEFKTFFTA
jgi:hypothetical protein